MKHIGGREHRASMSATVGAEHLRLHIAMLGPHFASGATGLVDGSLGCLGWNPIATVCLMTAINGLCAAIECFQHDAVVGSTSLAQWGCA